jgi:hypothetical protein
VGGPLVGRTVSPFFSGFIVRWKVSFRVKKGGEEEGYLRHGILKIVIVKDPCSVCDSMWREKIEVTSFSEERSVLTVE